MKINNVFPEWLTGGGIFSELDTLDVPWKSLNIGQVLDVQYHGNVSGGKFISPLIYNLLDENRHLTPENRHTLALVLFNMFGKNWQKLYDTLNFDYNPIENYNMVESSFDNRSGESASNTKNNASRSLNGSNNSDNSVNESTSTMEEGKDVSNADGSTSANSGLYGFNSSEAVNDTTTEGTSEGKSETERENTTNTTRGSSSNMNATSAENETAENAEHADTAHTESETHTLTRSGNVGVTTSQQMIQSERDLWSFNFFYGVFKDIDSVLAIKVY